ncbi:MAG: N-acetylmuramoyl-L-alanine amidase family protein, partial [Nitrospirota bacterium]
MKLPAIRLLALLFFILAASVALGQGDAGQVAVKYLGARSYYAFTRVVFETGDLKPEGFKINFDPVQKQMALYPQSGMMSLSFAPVRAVSDIVREVNFTEGTGQPGIVIRLSPMAAPGYRVSYLNEPNRIVLDFYDSGKSHDAGFLPLVRPVRTVAIDPGHGGRFFGSFRMGGMPEKELAMDMALRLRKDLTAMGYKVVLTREGDTEVSFVDRAGIANAARADLFISIHASGSYGTKGQGPAFYTLGAGELNSAAKSKGPMEWNEQNAPYLPDDLRLARALISATGALNGRAPELHQTRLAGFDGLAMPAVMAELGDLDDPDQAQQLMGDAYRDMIAAKLARGIE